MSKDTNKLPSGCAVIWGAVAAIILIMAAYCMSDSYFRKQYIAALTDLLKGQPSKYVREEQSSGEVIWVRRDKVKNNFSGDKWPYDAIIRKADEKWGVEKLLHQ